MVIMVGVGLLEITSPGMKGDRKLANNFYLAVFKGIQQAPDMINGLLDAPGDYIHRSQVSKWCSREKIIH